jgi:hypothetical protein
MLGIDTPLAATQAGGCAFLFELFNDLLHGFDV